MPKMAIIFGLQVRCQKEDAQLQSETILHIVLKFEVNHACFEAGVASVKFSGESERGRIDHLQ